jgi:N-acetylneuraminic acid mutarotase
MVNALVWHTATLLHDGRVLLAGGEYGSGSSTYPSAAQLFDPDTNTFSVTGSLATNRSGHAAALIGDGRVLVIGGSNSSGDLASAELYNPSTGTFEPADTLATAREFPTATVLPDGNILVSGGSHWNGSAYTYYASVEIFDSSIGTFSAGGSMTTPRERHQAAVLSDGRVLLVGGEDDSGAIDSAELYQP